MSMTTSDRDQPQFTNTDCFAILGTRGCGKSFLCRRVQDLYPKRVIIDSLNEYKSSGPNEVVSDFEVFCEKMLELKKSKKKKFQIIFQFNPEIENSDEIFNQILRVLYKFKNIQIVIEEVQLFASPHRLPHWLKQCLLTGRHQNLSLIFTTQRPGELNKTILSQCTHIFAGQMHEKNDLKYISGFLGVDTEKLINLEKRKFIYWRPGNEALVVNNTLSK